MSKQEKKLILPRWKLVKVVLTAVCAWQRGQYADDYAVDMVLSLILLALPRSLLVQRWSAALQRPTPCR